MKDQWNGNIFYATSLTLLDNSDRLLDRALTKAVAYIQMCHGYAQRIQSLIKK